MSYQHIMTDELVALDLGEIGSPLSLFASRIRKIFPRCSFAWQDSGGNLAVYHKNKPVAMGYVHVAPVYVDVSNPNTEYTARKREQTDRVSKPIYYVSSRKVSNDSRTGSDHYVVKTGNPEVAIRNVKKYFVEYNAVEIAGIDRRHAQSLWRRTLTQMTEDIRRLREEVCRWNYSQGPGGGTDPLISELRMLADTGYKFVNAEFGEKVRALLSAEADQSRELNERSGRIMMVSVEDSLLSEGNLYVTAYTDNIEDHFSAWTAGGTFVEDTLDPDVLRKLSALQLVEQDSWVDGVGFKSSERVYYVIR
jgi:hypothetical protein